MINENKQTIFDLAKMLVAALTKDLNSELNKLSATTSETDNTNVLNECDRIITKINGRLSQLK